MPATLSWSIRLSPSIALNLAGDGMFRMNL